MGGNVNSGKPWSEMDLRDLRNAMRFADSIEKIADFLCRDVEEVREKVAEIDPAYSGLSKGLMREPGLSAWPVKGQTGFSGLQRPTSLGERAAVSPRPTSPLR